VHKQVLRATCLTHRKSAKAKVDTFACLLFTTELHISLTNQSYSNLVAILYFITLDMTEYGRELLRRQLAGK
jgi:hypothetical protein